MTIPESSQTLESIKLELTPCHGQSNFSAVVNMVLATIGVGILSLPRAIAQAGYAFGFILMVFSAVVGILYTQLLRACMKPETRSYEDIGMDVFGRWGLFAVTFGVNGALIGTCCLLMLLLGQNSYKLYPGIAQPYWILIWTCILLPVSWLPNMKHIGYISGTVGVASVICLLLVLIYAGFARDLNPEIHDDISYDPYPVTAIGLGMSFASMTLAFAGTCASTTVLHDMKYPQARRRVVYWGLCIIAIVYFLVSLSGYIGWGNSLLKFQNIIDAVTGSGSGHDVVSYISICSILLLSVTHYAVLLNPSSRILEHAFNVKEGQFVKSCAIRSTLVAFTVIVAIFVPNFQGLIGLLGSVCFSLIHNFYPSIFYIRLFIWEKVRSGSKYHIMQFVGLTILLFISLAGSICGIYDSVLTLVS
ncbi:hypothetical protein FOL47_007936 [Perkinsus chesapeaki]|uniref:Amino acid transporter transmembrane domain-containing protein n=1 Tax=Perkinsus chesapeaki TaxID=330153 RepID=A0A7J6MUN6_PERCH|nr:hypothetical protein FOL47_007936 [Perkinsus chesapeaki]